MQASVKRSLLLGALVAWILGFALSSVAARSAERRRSALDGIAALEKPITYTGTKIPLGELVEKVAAETGVALAATPDVADEPVTVVVKEMPARQLLEEVAELLDYAWRPRQQRGRAREETSTRNIGSQVPAPVYEIYQDLA